jgi:hypothetical protein
MSDDLNRQLAAYHRLYAKITAENEPGWALIAHEELVKVFSEFDEASVYADEHFRDEQVVIRHTSEHRGIAPFIVAHR